MKMKACDTFCDEKPENDVEVIFPEKEKALKPLRFKAFRNGGISRARTYDLHDVK